MEYENTLGILASETKIVVARHSLIAYSTASSPSVAYTVVTKITDKKAKEEPEL